MNLARVKRNAKKLLQAEGCGENIEVSVVLTDDARIQNLNLQYLNKDCPTDVLAFSQDEDEELLIEGESRLLGDVIVSVDTAARQAEERGKPLVDELDLLVAHGILHLLGYDDATTLEREQMNNRIAEILGEEIAK